MALNKWVGMGRLTADPELRATPSGTSVATFIMAVERNFKGQDGQRQTDFINCIAWRQQAEFVKRYFSKGNMICVVGGLQTRSYTAQDGTKRFVTEVCAEEIQFTGEKSNTSQNANTGETVASAIDYEEIGSEEDLPF